MKETKSETSIPKYAPTMEPVESVLLRKRSDAKPSRSKHIPPPKSPSHAPPYALDMTPHARMMLSV